MVQTVTKRQRQYTENEDEQRERLKDSVINVAERLSLVVDQE